MVRRNIKMIIIMLICEIICKLFDKFILIKCFKIDFILGPFSQKHDKNIKKTLFLCDMTKQSNALVPFQSLIFNLIV